MARLLISDTLPSVDSNATDSLNSITLTPSCSIGQSQINIHSHTLPLVRLEWLHIKLLCAADLLVNL